MGAGEEDVKLKVLAVIATGIIVFSLGFETAKERLYERTSETMKPIITALFSELTTLGFIGLMLFVVFKLEWISELSEDLFGEESTIDELADTAHMVLFLIMVLFLAQVVGLVMLAEYIQSQWHTWELQCAHGEAEMPSLEAPARDLSCWRLFLRRFANRFPPSFRLALFAATRKTFMASQDLDHSFQFATYLSTALGTTIAEFVEIPARAWIAVECLLLCLSYVYSLMDPDAAFLFWVALGWIGGPVLTFVAHAKVRSILVIHCGSGVGGGGDASDAVVDGSESDLERPLVGGGSDTPGKADAAGGATPFSTFARSARDGLGLASGLNAAYEKNFWFGSYAKSRFTLDVMRLVTFYQSIYLAIFLVVYGEQLLGPRGSGTPAASSLCADSSRAVSVLLFAAGLAPPIWSTAKMNRLIEDFTVIAHIDVFVNRRFVQHVRRRQKTIAAFAALRVVQSFYDVERLRATTTANRRASTAMALHAPTRHGDGGGGGGGSSLSACLARCGRCLGVGNPPNVDAHASATLRLRRRRHWRTVFDVFDGDGQGSIEVAEIRDLLSKFPSACDVGAVVAALDTDGSGDIGFEELDAASEANAGRGPARETSFECLRLRPNRSRLPRVPDRRASRPDVSTTGKDVSGKHKFRDSQSERYLESSPSVIGSTSLGSGPRRTRTAARSTT